MINSFPPHLGVMHSACHAHFRHPTQYASRGGRSLVTRLPLVLENSKPILKIADNRYTNGKLNSSPSNFNKENHGAPYITLQQIRILKTPINLQIFGDPIFLLENKIYFCSPRLLFSKITLPINLLCIHKYKYFQLDGN
jgi:hypothetical protein